MGPSGVAPCRPAAGSPLGPTRRQDLRSSLLGSLPYWVRRARPRTIGPGPRLRIGRTPSALQGGGMGRCPGVRGLLRGRCACNPPAARHGRRAPVAWPLFLRRRRSARRARTIGRREGCRTSRPPTSTIAARNTDTWRHPCGCACGNQDSSVRSPRRRPPAVQGRPPRRSRLPPARPPRRSPSPSPRRPPNRAGVSQLCAGTVRGFPGSLRVPFGMPGGPHDAVDPRWAGDTHQLRCRRAPSATRRPTASSRPLGRASGGRPPLAT
jgi:hypothetical protein